MNRLCGFSFRRAALRRSTLFAATLSLAVGLIAVSGCDDDDDDIVGPGVNDAELRVLHLSPDAPGVDVFINGKTPPAVRNLTFPNGTGSTALEPGTYDIAIAATGRPVSEAVLTVNDLALERGTAYTAVAYDLLASLKVLPLVDDFSSVPAGQIRVRAIHTAAGVGQVDIWNAPLGGAAPSPLYPDFDFGEVGSYLTLPAGAYRLGFDVNNDATPDLLFNLPALPAGTVANVFAVRSGSAVFLIAQLGDGSTVRINAAA